MMKHLPSFASTMLRRIFYEEWGISTLETALVLVSFVIAASLFTYSMLSG